MVGFHTALTDKLKAALSGGDHEQRTFHYELPIAGQNSQQQQGICRRLTVPSAGQEESFQHRQTDSQPFLRPSVYPSDRKFLVSDYQANQRGVPQVPSLMVTPRVGVAHLYHLACHLSAMGTHHDRVPLSRDGTKQTNGKLPSDRAFQ